MNSLQHKFRSVRSSTIFHPHSRPERSFFFIFTFSFKWFSKKAGTSHLNSKTVLRYKYHLRIFSKKSRIPFLFLFAFCWTAWLKKEMEIVKLSSTNLSQNVTRINFTVKIHTIWHKHYHCLPHEMKSGLKIYLTSFSCIELPYPDSFVFVFFFFFLGLLLSLSSFLFRFSPTFDSSLFETFRLPIFGGAPDWNKNVP